MRDVILVVIVAALLLVVVARPFVGILLWSWISFMNPHRLGWDFAASLPFATAAFAATLLGCIVSGERPRPAINAITILLLGFLAYAAFTSTTALTNPDVVWERWETLLKIILGVLLTASLLTDRWRAHAMVWLMVISTGFYGVKGGLFTLASGGSSIVLGPPDTIIGDRNHLAVALLVAIPLMNYLRLHSRHRSVRLGLVVSMVLMLFAVVGSQSRGALVALLATAVIFLLRSRRKVLTGAILSVGLATAILFMPDNWSERMQSIEMYHEDRSAMGRVEIWQAAIAIVQDRPLTGGGFRAVYDQEIVDRYAPGTRARADHSIWFEALGEHGIPGFLLWFSTIVVGIIYSFRITSLASGVPGLGWAYDLARMSQVSIITYCVGGTFLSLAYWDMFWTLLVVIGATHGFVVNAVKARNALPRPNTRLPSRSMRSAVSENLSRGEA